MTCIKQCKSLILIQQALTQSRRFYSFKKKKPATDKALEHFDSFYGDFFGGKWRSMRIALQRKKKYAALVNNFGDIDETKARLENKGAHNIGNLFTIQKAFDLENNIVYEPLDIEEDESLDRVQVIATAVGQKEIAGIYPSNSQTIPDVISAGDITIDTTKKYVENRNAEEPDISNKSQTSNLSLASSISQAEMDLSRIIHPSEGFSSAALYQHIPATKLHGLEDWLPESTHFEYYSSALDFPMQIEPEERFEIPEHLVAYSYEADSRATFTEPARSKTGVVNYYLMDGASLLPVVALDLRGGEKVLDMCAAPGGKSLAILQTLLAGHLQSNDVSISRVNRMRRIFKDFLIEYETNDKWKDRSEITTTNAMSMTDKDVYDRILVDAPCTSDRLSVTEDLNSIFRNDRVKERLRLPEIQASLLTNALNLVKVGGVVVYSTCSLSPIQNDGVVHMALKAAFENNGVKAVIKDLTKCVFPLRNLFCFGFGRAQPKYGQLVIPHTTINFGPSYFAKIERVK